MAGTAREGLPPPLHHASIGHIQGVYRKGAVQYLGLRYATLAHRFADAEVASYSGHDTMDATRHGPPVVTPDGAAAMEMRFLQQTLPELDVPPMSDVDGLCINITVPENRPEAKKTGLLPVLVYVHGGGFAFGSSSYPHYDQSKVVELSSLVGTPIVAVNFKYVCATLGLPAVVSSR